MIVLLLFFQRFQSCDGVLPSSVYWWSDGLLGVVLAFWFSSSWVQTANVAQCHQAAGGCHMPSAKAIALLRVGLPLPLASWHWQHHHHHCPHAQQI